MIIRAKHKKGILDISSQQVHPDTSRPTDSVHFRLSLKPNQVVRINDEYRALKNIDEAIKKGFLEVISFDSDESSAVIQAELKGQTSSIKHSDLIDDEPEKHRLINDSTTGPNSLWSSEKVNNELKKLLRTFEPKTVKSTHSPYNASVNENIICNDVVPLTIKLPTASGNNGKLIIIKNINNGLVAIDAKNGETIDNNKTIYLSNRWESVILVSIGTGWLIAFKNISDSDWSSESS